MNARSSYTCNDADQLALRVLRALVVKTRRVDQADGGYMIE